MNNYETDARERWGNTDAYREHEQKTMNYTKEKWTEANDGLIAIFAEFAACKDSGASTASAKAQALIANLCKYFFVCWAEVIIWYFTRRYPSDIVMFQLLRFSIGNGGVEQRQMYRQVGIFVDDVHKHVTNRQSHGEFFLTLANERLFLRLARLNLAANKLPQKPSRLVRRTLADHEFIFVPYQCCYYFGHVTLYKCKLNIS